MVKGTGPVEGFTLNLKKVWRTSERNKTLQLLN